MTNYHPDVQRAYESHCADGYVVPDDETGPQEATGATESDETRVQAHGDGAGLREAVEAALGPVDGHEPGPLVKGPMTETGWLHSECECGEFAAPCPHALREQVDRVRAVLSAHPAPTGDRGALDETLDDLTRTLARAEKAEAGRDAWRRTAIGRADGLVKAGARLYHAEAERDRARDTAAALEAENARLTDKVGCAERLAVQYDAGMWPEWSVGDAIRAALSGTTGEAT